MQGDQNNLEWGTKAGIKEIMALGSKFFLGSKDNQPQHWACLPASPPEVWQPHSSFHAFSGTFPGSADCRTLSLVLTDIRAPAWPNPLSPQGSLSRVPLAKWDEMLNGQISFRGARQLPTPLPPATVPPSSPCSFRTPLASLPHISSLLQSLAVDCEGAIASA